MLYLATSQAIATVRGNHRDDNEAGSVDTLIACGGDTKNEVFVREHADASGCRILLPREPEAVLLGSAVLGAVASGDQTSVLTAMQAMNAVARTVQPARGVVGDYHARKHEIFQRMHADQLAYAQTMGRDVRGR